MKLIAITTAALLAATAAHADDAKTSLEACYRAVFVSAVGTTMSEYEEMLADETSPLHGDAVSLENSVRDTAAAAIKARNDGVSVDLINLGAAIGLGDSVDIYTGVETCNYILL